MVDVILLIIPKINHKMNLEHSKNNLKLIWNILVKFEHFYFKKAVVNEKNCVVNFCISKYRFFFVGYFFLKFKKMIIWLNT